MINELDLVALTVDLPEYKLKTGDIGTVVDVYAQGNTYQIEVTTVRGKTIAVVPVLSTQIRLIGDKEVASTRLMEVV
jgi:ribosomal 30S subunit maturation factor RimM